MRLKSVLVVFTTFLIFQTHDALAQKIPPHISSMTAGITNKLRGEIEHTQDPVLTDAGRILKEERIHQWSKKPAKIKGGAKALADAVGLDITKAKDWLAIKKMLEKSDISDRLSHMKKVLESRGLPSDENTVLESLANFDLAKKDLFENMETEHAYKISKNEKASMQWDPESGQYEMRITSARDKEGKEPQQTMLFGDIKLQPSKDGDDLEMITKPSGKGYETLTYEEIKAKENSIFGEWQMNDETWFIRLDEDTKSFQKGSGLPVDSNNPLKINTMAADGALPIIITVVRADGSEYIYRNAYLSGLMIKADRTLTDGRDITSLPQSVINQLISSWSPPEWIDLEIVHGRSPRDTHIKGHTWRLHVTYKSGIAGPGPVTKIANPYKEKQLHLTRDIESQYKKAQGAKDKESL